MNKQIKVYTQKDHAGEKDWLKYLIHPIRAYWGDGTPQWVKWGKNFEFYKELFILTEEITESDVAFLPLTYNYYSKYKKLDLLNNFVNQANNFNKISFIWVDGDSQPKYNSSKCVLLKYSGYKSKLKKNEIILPGDLKQDLLAKYCNGKLKLLKKCKYPRVGFVGHGDIRKIKLIYQIFKNSIRKISLPILNDGFENEAVIPFVIKRKKILNTIASAHHIETDIKIRKSYAAGIKNGNNQNRQEFITNIVNNDYTVCMRGGGNYSIRFYETLCLGRIPIMVNTDCKLPFEEKINWKEICVWINENDSMRINDVIIDYHNNITEKQFIERQNYCREIWVKYLSKEGFYNQFYSYLEENYMKS